MKNEKEKGNRNASAAEMKLSESEYRLMDIIWDREPVGSTELAKACLELLGWKKSTSYTMLKKLVDKRAVKNQDAVVTALIKREQVIRYESEALLEKSFGGSLPDFFAAFLQDRKLSREEAERLARMIEEAAE